MIKESYSLIEQDHVLVDNFKFCVLNCGHTRRPPKGT